MNQSLVRLFVAAFLVFASPLIAAQSTNSTQPASPVGLWKTIDDETGEAKSLVRIVQNNGVLTGRIEKILPPGDPKAVCENCDGDLKGKPVQGMAIINGMKPGKDGYEDGTIMDPKNGKTYRCLLWLEPNDANKLNVRGFIGVSLFGRSQTWLRATDG